MRTLFNFLSMFAFDADDGGGGGDDQPTWEKWLEKQTEDVKALFEGHVKGLKSALASEREKSKSAVEQAKRLADLEEAEKKRREAELSETEKLQQQLAEKDGTISEWQSKHEKALAEMATRSIKSAVKLTATQMGFADPDDAYNLADFSGIEIEEGTDDPQGVKEALEALSKAKPYLLKQGANGKLPGTPPGKQPGKKPDNQPEDRKVPLVRL
jgi:hypothetical protein